ncbi:leptin receptor-like isoform X1, partial [Clarias magur]
MGDLMLPYDLCSRESAKENRDMDIFTDFLRLVLLLLLNCELRGCYKVDCTGQLIIDQDVIPMGSNLTVHCQSNTESCGRVFIMKFNQKEVLRKTSCSSVTAQVLVSEPKFSLYCLLEIQGKHHIICGRDIIANPTPPSLCSISLFVETSEEVSCPSFKQIHMIEKGTETTLKDIIDPHVDPQILPVPSHAEKMKNGLVVGICLIIAVPLIIIVNLMYLKCTRQRLRKVCVSVGPSWLFQNLPTLGNSNAIKLLK